MLGQSGARTGSRILTPGAMENHRGAVIQSPDTWPPPSGVASKPNLNRRCVQ
ncbi:hypothetical protein K60_009470 [Mycobacterium tuberculosis variant bovis BCG str. Korea 1168P]|uniref:Uncharacterized protein n=1 Tax=Mycobacterium tuberculosis (strain CDC 1551 / Oshkosh) TaxID=83331 RepID=Q8VKC2_MYCTO|nr:hypothetical protein MT0910.1 [Mycobacterium tuberculosis CDC1551]AGE66857.1 hypothetical protein K60_009470 [Mycobacterium tuberculosis variant bovis BCG str. Korea 1168P]AIB47470.1 hypothetical protein MTBK_09240 [Mycobacterium tuberculosis K]AKR00515.1 hypothetical protein Mb1595_p0992 [Mycobacterium tuberculosis variant bovis]EFD46254.1 conserved hypothetical protein [Mycobacterium tuberculosis T17]EPZ63829.1 hypothetical protein TBKG_01518 [Mycobacterium tuberculosis '98-R604 INH-RIF-E